MIEALVSVDLEAEVEAEAAYVDITQATISIGVIMCLLDTYFHSFYVLDSFSYC